jgi:hypothetical protein
MTRCFKTGETGLLATTDAAGTASNVGENSGGGPAKWAEDRGEFSNEQREHSEGVVVDITNEPATEFTEPRRERSSCSALVLMYGIFS